MGREMGGRFKREGIICIPMADSCWGLTEKKKQNSVKQLSFKKNHFFWKAHAFSSVLSHLWLYDCLDYCPPITPPPAGSSVHGIFQARMEQVAVSCSRWSSLLMGGTLVSCVFCIGRQILYHCATWEALSFLGFHINRIMQYTVFCV